jgi:hypothetical protein
VWIAATTISPSASLSTSGSRTGRAPALDRLRERVAGVVDPERDVAHAVAVPVDVVRDLAASGLASGPDRGGEHEAHLALLEQVAGAVAHAGLGPR